VNVNGEDKSSLQHSREKCALAEWGARTAWGGGGTRRRARSSGRCATVSASSGTGRFTVYGWDPLGRERNRDCEEPSLTFSVPRAVGERVSVREGVLQPFDRV